MQLCQKGTTLLIPPQYISREVTCEYTQSSTVKIQCLPLELWYSCQPAMWQWNCQVRVCGSHTLIFTISLAVAYRSMMACITKLITMDRSKKITKPLRCFNANFSCGLRHSYHEPLIFSTISPQYVICGKKLLPPYIFLVFQMSMIPLSTPNKVNKPTPSEHK
jgi:hypothetical protein